MGEWEAWIKAGTGDDKTDIVVVADFWERTGGLSSRDRSNRRPAHSTTDKDQRCLSGGSRLTRSALER
jgi:hypothetical protein